ncbi:MAG: HEPN domain-containing protein [Candidatus Edwardsbacteria bacterium]
MKNKDNNLYEAQRWINQAEKDLATAKWDFKGKFYSQVCFMCQQVGEKALKAFCYQKGERNVIGHTVMELARKCCRLDCGFPLLEREARRLDKYYIITRYPNGLPGFIPADYFDEEEAKEALEYAKKILNIVKRKISRGGLEKDAY